MLVHNSRGSSSLVANLLCFTAAFSWSIGFPAGSILLESWDLVTLLAVRLIPGTLLLVVFWRLMEGKITLSADLWLKGMTIGGIGFGFGTTLLLYGQSQSNPVTPVIAAAMMPVAAAMLEVVLDKKRLSASLFLGLICAVTGGLIAAGVKWGGYDIGVGFLWCLLATILYAWATRETNKRLDALTSLGQTVVTIVGAAAFIAIVWVAAVIAYPENQQYGALGGRELALLFVFSILSVSISQPCWIAGARGLGVTVASFHLNAVPFYVMAIMVFLNNGSLDMWRLFGAVIVIAGVTLAQNGEKAFSRLPDVRP